MKTQLNTFQNKEYSPKKGFLMQFLWYFVNVLFLINPLNPISFIKVLLLKCFGATIGKGVVIKPGVNVKYPWLLKIGDYCWIGENVWIDNLEQITIEDNCCLSQGSMLLTGSHNYKITSFDLITGEIVLEEGVWIGAHSIVCPGVTCKSHSVLAVNSVATKDLNAYQVYQGNPAETKRTREIK